MKVFSFRNIVGLAAIGGAYAYAKKHGGFKNAFDHLMKKKDELVKDFNKSTTGTTYGTDTGATGYTGSKLYDRH